MKFILTALAMVLLVGIASAGFLHGGWSAPVYRRVVYSSPSYHGGYSGGYGGSGGGWSKGYGGSRGWSGGYGGYSSYGGSGGWNSGWW